MLRFLRNRVGTSATLMVLGFTTSVVVTGMAIDGSMMYQKRKLAQVAADSGALAAAMYVCKSTGLSAEQGIKLATLNGVAPSDVQVQTPAEGHKTWVSVTTKLKHDYLFMGILGLRSTTVMATATAESRTKKGSTFQDTAYGRDEVLLVGKNVVDSYDSGAGDYESQATNTDERTGLKYAAKNAPIQSDCLIRVKGENLIGGTGLVSDEGGTTDKASKYARRRDKRRRDGTELGSEYGHGDEQCTSTDLGHGDSGHDSGHSSEHGNNGVGNGEDPAPPGEPQVNDGEGTSPGNPGAQGGTPSSGGHSALPVRRSPVWLVSGAQLAASPFADSSDIGSDASTGSAFDLGATLADGGSGHDESGHGDSGGSSSGHGDSGHTDSGHTDSGHSDSGHGNYPRHSTTNCGDDFEFGGDNAKKDGDEDEGRITNLNARCALGHGHAHEADDDAKELRDLADRMDHEGQCQKNRASRRQGDAASKEQQAGQGLQDSARDLRRMADDISSATTRVCEQPLVTVSGGHTSDHSGSSGHDGTGDHGSTSGDGSHGDHGSSSGGGIPTYRPGVRNPKVACCGIIEVKGPVNHAMGDLIADGPIVLKGEPKVDGRVSPYDDVQPFKMASVDMAAAIQTNNNSLLVGKLGYDATRNYLRLSGDADVTLSAGTYYLKKLVVSGQAKLRITEGTKIFVSELFRASENAQVNPDQRPGHLQIFLAKESESSDEPDFVTRGAAKVRAMVLNHDGDISVLWNSQLYGQAVAGGTLEVRGQAGLHVDVGSSNLTGNCPMGSRLVR